MYLYFIVKPNIFIHNGCTHLFNLKINLYLSMLNMLILTDKLHKIKYPNKIWSQTVPTFSFYGIRAILFPYNSELKIK